MSRQIRKKKNRFNRRVSTGQDCSPCATWLPFVAAEVVPFLQRVQRRDRAFGNDTLRYKHAVSTQLVQSHPENKRKRFVLSEQ